MTLAYENELEPEADAEFEDEAASQVDQLIANISVTNLADGMDEVSLTRLGAKVVEEYKIDDQSRKESGWEERHDAGLKLAMLVQEAKTYPWPNASNVKFPAILVACLQFAARAYPAIVDGAGVARGKVLGRPDEAKRARADRVGKHMSWQLLDQMPEWEEETDELLHILPCTGTVHRKSYYDPSEERNCSEIVTSDKLVVNYRAKRSPARMTQICEFYPHEIKSKVLSGLWLDVDLGRPASADNDDDAPHTFLEQHRYWDLDGDGVVEPYIVTTHLETERVVRVYARYEAKGIKANRNGQVYCVKPIEYFTRYRLLPAPDRSYYGVGFGTLLCGLNETINSTINQLMDAGHLANTQGGFIGSGVSIKSGRLRFEPGEWKRAEVSGGVLKDNIVPLPVGEPSTVLFNLLGLLIEAAKDITATKDILTGETQGANQAVGTTLAMIEQGLKVFSAIYKRIHRSLKHELGCLFRLNSAYLDDEEYFAFQDEEGVVAREDYDTESVDITPVSDPTVVTDMQRLGRAQYLGQFLGKGLNDLKIVERMLEAASINDIKELMPEGPPPPSPELLLKERELDLKEREIAIKESAGRVLEARAKADNTGKYASALAALAGIGATPEGNMGINPEALMLAEDLHDTATQEVEDEAVRPEEFRGMEGPPPDQAVPAIPEGPAGDPGPQMDGGGGDFPPVPDQGGPDGGVGGPGMA